MNEKGRVEPEMLVAMSAVVIGVCALAVSLYETSLMREEQRSAVLPLVEISRSYYVRRDEDESEWRLHFHAENVGIGPAVVRDFRVTVDGKAQQTWREAMAALTGREERVRYSQSTINGRTIPPERKITMFELADRALAPEIAKQLERLEMEACFCSVFDQCWTTSYTGFGTAEPVARCTRSPESFTE